MRVARFSEPGRTAAGRSASLLLMSAVLALTRRLQRARQLAESWPYRFLMLVALASTATAALAEDSIRVFQITLSMSNVHLIKSGKRCFLVDTGSKDDLPALAAALAREGVRFRDLAAVILTHGHADHAGLAAEVRRRSGAVVIAGRGDRSMLESGVNEPVTPTSFTARLILILPLDPRYEPLRADVEVDGERDLASYGLAGRVLPVPGHTPGSLAVVLDDGRAFVGDMMLGGWLGGALFAHRPGEHYFHMDVAGNGHSLAALANLPIRQYFLGHGGPLSQEAVREYLGREGAAR